MNFSEDILAKIECYLDGNMNADELEEFENLVKSDEQLSEYIEVNRQMRLQYSNQDWGFMEDSKDNSELNELASLFEDDKTEATKKAIIEAGEGYLSEEPTTEKKGGRTKFYYAFTIAASIALLISFLLNDHGQTNNEIYLSYDGWSELPSLVERGDLENEMLMNGERAFENRNYKEAKELFGKVASSAESFNANVALYLGISQLELDEYDGALSSFQKLIESNSIDASKGYWYQGLVYLKMDDRVNAIRVFEKITADTSNYNYAEAEEILEKIK